MPAPRFAQIEPVGQCNLRCRMCPIQYRPDGPPHGPPAFMDFALFRRLVDDMPELRELQLQGLGEPLMHPRFFDMVRYAVDKGIHVSTNSNLTLLSVRRARQCIECGLGELHVSLDGATPATFESIRLRARFKRVVDNLHGLMASRAEAGAALPRVRLVTVIMRRNLHELPEVVRLAFRLGVDRVFVQHLCHDFSEEALPERYRPMRRFVDGESLLGEDADRVMRYFHQAETVAEALDVDLRLPRTRPRAHPPGTPGPKRCDWPWKGPYISYDGQVMPCCMVSTPDRARLGDVKHDHVQRLWRGKAYGEFRDRLASEDPPAVCAACSLYHGVF